MEIKNRIARTPGLDQGQTYLFKDGKRWLCLGHHLDGRDVVKVCPIYPADRSGMPISGQWPDEHDTFVFVPDHYDEDHFLVPGDGHVFMLIRDLEGYEFAPSLRHGHLGDILIELVRTQSPRR